VPARLLSAAKIACLGAAAGYLAAGAVLWSYQRHLIFEPARVMQSSPGEYSFPVVETEVSVGAGRIHGWWVPGARADSKAVLYLHGNDGNISTSMLEIAPLRQLGFSVFLIDYRGFGKSEGGFPSEQSVYEDAEAAWTYLVRDKGIAPRELYIYGHSLGGAIAIELATRHREAAGLVVESSFTSIYDMARLESPYALFPVKLFLNQKFDSLAKVERLALPVLYIHGTADEIVPFGMSERLFGRSGGAKRLVAIPGGRHDNNAAAGGAAFRAALRSFVEDSQRDRQRALYSSSM